MIVTVGWGVHSMPSLEQDRLPSSPSSGTSLALSPGRKTKSALPQFPHL